MTRTNGIALDRLRDHWRSHGLAWKDGADHTASAQAPGHSDKDRSVTFRQIAGGVLMNSHADDKSAVLDALGLTMRDLFDDADGATYRYRDGREVRRTYRDNGRKSFRQDGNTKGRDLFRAERLDSHQLGTPVYVVEGEKDVLALESVGATAVCNAMGAGKSHLFDWSPLTGHTVVIVTDDDEPGRRHAAQVREILTPITAGLAVVQAAHGKDAADHIAAGYGLDEFQLVPELNPEPSGVRAWKATELECARRVEWLASLRIVAGAVNYMLGPEGIGKSLFLAWLAAIVTTGKPFPQFGIPARDPRTVVLVLTEDDWSTIARPRLEAAGADLERIVVLCEDPDGSGAPTFPRDMPIVEQAARGAAVVMVDAWADTLPGSLSVKDPQQARQALHPWKELGTRTGATILLTGHTNREKGGNVRNAYGLSGEIRKKARMTLLAQPDQEEEGVLVIGPEKSNVAPTLPASRFRIASVRMFDPNETSDGMVPVLQWVGDAEQSARDFFADAAAAENGDGADERNDVDEWLRQFLAHGSQKANEVYSAADANGFSKDQIKRAKRRIGAVAERPVNPGPWFWSIPATPQGAGSTVHPDSISALPVLPALPVRSEGVQQGAESTGSRVQGDGNEAHSAPSGDPAMCPECGFPVDGAALGRSLHPDCERLARRRTATDSNLLGE
ncbi:AAA family ATPase [Rhodococcus ruber]|uniref:AAA family ATPase n=1 Tax=Rhodococcus ruber TaxID=1830 RepID=UPI0026586292|nr:AAA family ATPase [Rhodococcus ruber]WKK13874.1 AAA family ATPase [Rhodococcus ruber]